MSREGENPFDEEITSDGSFFDLNDDSDADSTAQLHPDLDTSKDPARSFNTPCHVLLPVEVWERIMLNTDIKDIPSIIRVSKQHHAISQMVSFRARYLLQHNMRCEAIYQASLHPLLFTPQLLEVLLKMGAIMSRHFVLRLHQRYSGIGHHSYDLYRRSFWTKRIKFDTYIAVLSTAHRLYGETIVLRDRNDEANIISQWTTSKDQFDTISKAVEEIFVCGRYAPHDKQDEKAHHMIGAAIAKHPDLIDTLEKNGYDFKEADPGSIVANLFTNPNLEEAELYERIVELLLRYPNWEAGAACCKRLLRMESNEVTWAITIPKSQHEQQELWENDGIGPVPAAFKVLKRLHVEGKAFQDLDQHLVPFLRELNSYESPFPRAKAAGYRILYRYFPEMLYEVREDLASEYIVNMSAIPHLRQIHLVEAFVEAWHYKYSQESSNDARSEVLHLGLIRQMIPFKLSPAQVARLLGAPDLCQRIILPALEEGLFCSDWVDKLGTIFQTLISRHLENPLAGKQIIELADVAMQCHKRGYIGEDFFINQLHTVVNSWILDLDLLTSDQAGSESIKFRSPLGWMVVGVPSGKSKHFYGSHTTLRPLDPYSLMTNTFRDSRRVYLSSRADVTFSLSQDLTKASLLIDDSTIHSTKGKASDFAEKKITTAPLCVNKGWKHIGHLDETTGDLITVSSQNQEFEEGEQGTQDGIDSMNDVMNSDRDARATEAVQQANIPFVTTNASLVTQRGSTYPIINKQIHLATCDELSRCSQQYMLGTEVVEKETAQALIDLLDVDSPAIRDVLLSHALINGNVELVQKMTRGEYHTKIAGDEVPKGPVLPTLAHLLTLQKLKRRPLKVFWDCILRGAPFKRGHVKSLPARLTESSVSLRWQWYKLKGHDDDRPMKSLYEKKIRLERIDDNTKTQGDVEANFDAPDAGGASTNILKATVGLETEDEEDSEDEGDLDLQASIAEKLPAIKFHFEEINYKLNLMDLKRQCKSLSLWKGHLEIVQWIEKREAKMERARLADINKTAEVKEKMTMSPFLLGLNEMIKKIVELESIIQRHLIHSTTKRKQEVKTARQRRWQEFESIPKDVEKKRKAKISTKDESQSTELSKGSSSCKRKKGAGANVDVIVETDGTVDADKDVKRRRSSRLAR